MRTTRRERCSDAHETKTQFFSNGAQLESSSTPRTKSILYKLQECCSCTQLTYKYFFPKQELYGITVRQKCIFIALKGTESNQILTQHILPTVSYYAVHPSLPTFVIFVAKHPIRGTVTDRAIYLVESENAYNISDLLSQFWFYRHKNKISFTFGNVFRESDR